MQHPAAPASSATIAFRQGGAPDDDDVVQDLFVGLPFELPPTALAGTWLDELDFVDPYMGSLEDLEDLAQRAPSESARQWLRGMIAARGFMHAFVKR